MRRHPISKQQGAAMVEMSLVITLFLSMVFAIFEFAFAVYYATRLSEATRAGVRYAAVSNISMADLQAMSCAELQTVGYRQCDLTTCGSIIGQMTRIINIDPANVYIRYQCASTGYTQQAGYQDASKDVYSITIKLQGVKYPLIIPRLLGLATTITMPSFESTRLSEDLWSVTN